MTNVNTTQYDYQVLIAGGGPAGIATALTLTARGISNCVIEATAMPIKKLGEAVPPNSKPLLKKLGILQLLKSDAHIAYYGNKSSWGNNKLEQKEFIKWIHGHGFLLDRQVFEQQLRDHLVNNGGQLLVGRKIKKVTSSENGVLLTVEHNNQSSQLSGQYIVDATGRKAAICGQLGAKKLQLDTQFALAFSATLKQPVERQILVEATKCGWWYAAPQNSKELTLMFFTLKELIPKKTQLKSYLMEQLKASQYVSKITKDALLNFNTIKIMPTGTSRLKVAFGTNWVAVGDAAYSYDPI